MAKYNSSGWHFQSERHSKARLTGHAGGKYESSRVSKILQKHPEYKNLTFKQLKGKGVFLKYQSDADKDGVKNIHDCRPLNKKAQDEGMSKEEFKKTFRNVEDYNAYLVGASQAEEENKKDDSDNYLTEASIELKKAKEEKIKTPEKNNKIKDWMKKEYSAIKEKTDQEITKYRNNKRIDEIKELDNKLTEIRNITGQDIDDPSDLDLKTLTKPQLQQLAEITPRALFGDNRYESELKRRINAHERIKTDLIIEEQEAKKIAKERLESTKPQKNKGYIWD